MRHSLAIVLGAALATLACAAWADDPPPKPLRLLGAAPAAPPPDANAMPNPTATAPTAFVIDAVIKPGDTEAQSTIEGWFAAIQEPAASSEATGSCVDTHCTITVSLEGGKLTLTGDYGGPGGGPARFTVKDDDGKVLQSGTATLTPLAGDVPGLGALAAPDAINEADMDDLLVWAGQQGTGGSGPSDPVPSTSQRQSLASWQGDKQRLATGLIFAADLDQLRADRTAAQKAAGWTPIGDPAHGWSAGYPAAALPVVSQAGAETHFASADGKAVLVVAIDPPMASDAFDAFVEKTTADRAGRDQVNVERVNGDLDMSYREGGVITVASYHNRDGGLGRLIFTYPAKRDKDFDQYTPILQRQFKVTDDLKP
jgi:hypothetical protein